MRERPTAPSLCGPSDGGTGTGAAENGNRRQEAASICLSLLRPDIFSSQSFHAYPGHGMQRGGGDQKKHGRAEGSRRWKGNSSDTDQVAERYCSKREKAGRHPDRDERQVDYINHVTVGVGINVNTTEFPEEISRTATSLRLECGGTVRRAPIIASIMERLEANYETFLRTEDLTGLMDRYSSMLVNRGRDVKVIGVKETYRAHALGITPEGELVVRREDGREEKINAGEVSVRGVYGYV